MVLGRRKNQERDPFGHLAGERGDAESGDPWFLDPDDAPELDLQAGVSSNLRDDEPDAADQDTAPHQDPGPS